MALFTERAIQRHPVAVVLIETRIKDIDKGVHKADFEWFNSVEAAEVFMTQWTNHAAKDSAEFPTDADGEPALAYLTFIIPNTETMAVGTEVVYPKTAAAEQWRDSILDDITALYEKAEAAPKKAPVVKARRGLKLAGKTTKPEPESETPKPRVRRVMHKHEIEGPQ